MQASYYPTIHGDLIKRVNLLRFIREFTELSGFEDGYYMEFGVLNGESMADVYRQLRGSPIKHYYGFDSFEGLPELSKDDQNSLQYTPCFYEGNFKSMQKDFVKKSIMSTCRIKEEDLTLVEGFFSDSLKSFNKDMLKDKGSPLLVYIDCDLYSSTKDVLEFITDLVIDGTWILFDDYWTYRGSPEKGEQKAIREWLKKNKHIELQDYCNFNGWGKAFIVHKYSENDQ